METPNTRSQPASQEGSGITWSRDTELLDALLARPAQPLPLPSPTQRPRAFAPCSTGGPRKRPCRVRSATPSLSTSFSTSRSTSRSTSLSTSLSTPSTVASARSCKYDGRRLDELLEKFDVWRTPSSSARSQQLQPQPQPQQRRPLGERTNRMHGAQSLPDIKTDKAPDRRARTAPLPDVKSDVKPVVRPVVRRASPAAPAPGGGAPGPAPPGERRASPMAPAPGGGPPGPAPPVVGPVVRQWAAVTPPVRSSPRRKPPVDYSPRPMRAPAAARPTLARPTIARPTLARPTLARPTPVRPTSARPTPARPTPARPTPARPTSARPTPAGQPQSRLRQTHAAAPTAPPAPPEPMPSSEGNTSIDSFDMLLHEGGDDVQDLFSMMDTY